MGYEPSSLPAADWVSRRIISLPLYPSMTTQDLEDVAGAIRRIATYYRRDAVTLETLDNAQPSEAALS